jgi:hypothetical protein
MEQERERVAETVHRKKGGAAVVQIRRVSGITIRVDGRGLVVWCDDWAELLQLALRGHTNVKPSLRGDLVWVG